MATKKMAHEAKSFKELEEILGEDALTVVLQALKSREDQRVYHKRQYLKRQAILVKARKLGITA